MPIETAKKHFLGKDGCLRLNCAQSIIHTFKENFNINDDTVNKFRGYGSGRAPEGACGAFYAAKYILEQNNLDDKIVELEDFFLQNAGSTKCKEIRSLRKLSCVGCIEKSSEFLVKSIKIR